MLLDDFFLVGRVLRLAMMRLFVIIDPVGGLQSQCGSDHRRQSGHSQEIVRGGRHFALLFELPSTHESAASQAAHRLAPGEDFLDTLPNALTHLVVSKYSIIRD